MRKILAWRGIEAAIFDFDMKILTENDIAFLTSFFFFVMIVSNKGNLRIKPQSKETIMTFAMQYSCLKILQGGVCL